MDLDEQTQVSCKDVPLTPSGTLHAMLALHNMHVRTMNTAGDRIARMVFASRVRDGLWWISLSLIAHYKCSLQGFALLRESEASGETRDGSCDAT